MCGGKGSDREEGSDDSEEEGWEGSWLASMMEGLEERGEGELPTNREEAETFWHGGGQALRSKRCREWEDGGWEQWEIMEERSDSAVQTCTNVLVQNESCDGDENSEGKMEDMVMDDGGNGGEVVGESLPGGEPKAGRKPLRGKRRGKKGSITKEEKKRLALYMSRWLGIRLHRDPENETDTTRAREENSR